MTARGLDSRGKASTRASKPDVSQSPAYGESQLVELDSGVDALYFSARGTLSPTFAHNLRSAKSAVLNNQQVMQFPLGRSEFKLLTGSFNRYPYCLQHEHGRIGIVLNGPLPTFRVQARAAFIHAVGAERAIEWFDGVLSCISDHAGLRLSRMDLYADWQGLSLTADDRHDFVGQLRKIEVREQGKVLQTLAYGTRSRHSIFCRIYDKTAELKARSKPKQLWYEKWGPQFDESRPVIRVEFQYGSGFLAQFGVRSAREALHAKGDLWKYATTKGITFRRPTKDKTRSRWPIRPEWSQIQAASLSSSVLGLSRMKQVQRSGSIDSIMPTMVGCLAKLAALRGVATESEAIDALRQEMAAYEAKSQKAFGQRVLDHLDRESLRCVA